MFNKFVAASVMLVTLPLTAIACCYSKVVFGNAIFKQKRLGKNNIEFTIYKIQTMSDSLKTTKLSNIMRKLHIDELPQMVNILQGNLNVFGVRPIPLNEWVEHIKRGYVSGECAMLRHSIAPGILGIAQLKLQRTDKKDFFTERYKLDLCTVKILGK